MDWNGLHFLHVLASAKTLAEAARRLEVDESTVSRRLKLLERHRLRTIDVRVASGRRYNP